MRTLFTFAVILFVGVTSFSQETKAEFKFDMETINYGKIKQGANGVRVFEFTNVGNAPLVITKVVASCGCTVPKKPEKPILPGERGKIEVSYDTKRVGGFSKAITIYSNAKSSRKMVKIRGFVEKADTSQ